MDALPDPLHAAQDRAARLRNIRSFSERPAMAQRLDRIFRVESVLRPVSRHLCPALLVRNQSTGTGGYQRRGGSQSLDPRPDL